MHSKDQQILTNLTRSFYNAHADSFSSTRSSAWNSWATILEMAGKPESILDIGCGNGRFASYLASTSLSQTEYLGLDPEPQLLEHAPTNSNQHFAVGDIETALGLEKAFDLVVLFGVMHHLPDADYRSNVVKNLGSLLNPNGLLAISFWQPLNLPSFQNKVSHNSTITLEHNDFLLGWQNDFSELRYCHHFDDDEINRIGKQSRLSVVAQFSGSGNDSTNVYLILRDNRP